MRVQKNDTKDWLGNSWLRSREAGLRPHRLPDNIRLAKNQLSERRDNAIRLIRLIEHYALPLFNQMFAKTNSQLIVTDSQGVIIGSWGQKKFQDRLTTISLESGVCWQEKLKGTNAIGTAMIEKKPVSIIGDEHFIHQHRFISCSASPIFDHQGNMLGILDITSEQQIHYADTHYLVQNMVQKIENSLLLQLPEGSVQVELACESALLDSNWQGIVIANQEGEIIAHNKIAAQIIQCQPILGCQLDALLNDNHDSFVYRIYSQQNKQRPTARTYSPACPLHYGDKSIETAWQQACKVINKGVSLLLLGETGVGKGKFVKALHQHSKRHDQPLVTVNCGALPSELIESELFGYAAGAFTGANRKGYQGKIRQAHKGVLFLDEIADMPLEAQCRLLHVLQEKEVVPIGSNQCYEVDIQIIAATHKNIEELVQQGAFRQDLYYRLNGLIFHLPPLRQREDKKDLIEALHNQHTKIEQKIEPSLMRMLEQYPWPGNIRELDNLLRVASLLASTDKELRLAHIPEHIAASFSTVSISETNQAEPSLQETVDDTLIRTYQAHKSNITRTAKALNISRNTLYRKLKKLGLK